MVKKIIFVVAVILLSFAVGLIAGIGYGSKTAETESLSQSNKILKTGKYKDNFADGWGAARKKLADSGFVMMSEVNSLNGQIKEINNKKIVFTTNLLNPLDDESLKTRTILLTPQTKIILKNQKTQAEVQKEEEYRNQKLKSLRENLEKETDGEKKMEISMKINDLEMFMISYYKETDGKISDLKQGYNIKVEADGNISEKKEFNARKITIDEMSISGAGYSGNIAPPAASGATGGVIAPPPTSVNSGAKTGAVVAPPPAASGVMGGAVVPPPPANNATAPVVAPPPAGVFKK